MKMLFLTGCICFIQEQKRLHENVDIGSTLLLVEVPCNSYVASCHAWRDTTPYLIKETSNWRDSLFCWGCHVGTLSLSLFCHPTSFLAIFWAILLHSNLCMCVCVCACTHSLNFWIKFVITLCTSYVSAFSMFRHKRGAWREINIPPCPDHIQISNMGVRDSSTWAITCSSQCTH